MNKAFLINLVALSAGLLFGFGLAWSQMVDANKVLNFLDIAGHWDPSLAFVLGGAVGVSMLTFRPALRRPKPLIHTQFHLASGVKVDRPLIIGAGIFGIGWGLAGYCPGPAVAALSLGSLEPWIFVPALILGSLTYKRMAADWE